VAANNFFVRGIVRHGVGLAIALTCIFFSAGRTSAQGDPNAAIRAREALRTGIDLFKKQDYEKAAEFFDYAAKGHQGLNASDMDDLTKFSAQNVIALRNRQDGGAQLRLADDAIQQNRLQDAANLLKSLNANQYLNASERTQLGELQRKHQAATSQAAQAPRGDAKSLLASGRAALQANDLASAEAMAAQAEKASSLMPSWLQPWNDSPSKLRRDIQAARNRQQQAMLPPKTEPAKDSSWMPGLGKLFGSSDKPKDASDRRVDEMMARQIVKDGFVFLEANDMEKAKFLAIKAKEMNATWNPNEQTPDMLLHEIQRRTGGPAIMPVTAKSAPTETLPDSNDPRVLIKQGRSLMAQKKYDEADKVCTKAASLKARYGLFEDTPDKLRRDLQRARTSHERDESPKVMAEARKLFAAGQIDDAEKLAFKAKQMHGPYGVFDFGDRPDKLLEDIQRTRQAKGLTAPKDNVTVAPKDGPGIGVAPPVGVNFANKNRAVVMLREAAELERQGMLVEARQKALEARELKAPFSAEEESPDSVLSRLYATCDRYIVTYLQHAAGIVTQASDSMRFDKAREQIDLARKLAHQFQLDSGRIDQTAHYVQQVQAGSRPVSHASAQVPAGGGAQITLANLNVPTGDAEKDAARMKLHQAQLELQAGKTAQARKMAEKLYAEEPAIQVETLALIRSISAEEYNQQIIEAKRTFDAGLDAFLQKDFRKAHFVFKTIDTMRLPIEYQARLRDIMATKEMQPEITQTGNAQFIPGSKMIEPKMQPNVDGGPENLIDPQKAKDLVRYQALRQRGVEVMRNAHEMFKEGKKERKDQAIATLRSYVEQVKAESLDSHKTADLCRMPEARMQQYKTVLSGEEIKGLQGDGRFVMKHDMGSEILKNREKQKEIADRVKVVRDLYKQNKLKEADAEIAKVLEIDSENLAARSMKMMIQTKYNQQEHDRLAHGQEEFFIRQLNPDPTPSLNTQNPIEINGNRVRARAKSDGSVIHQLRDPKEKAIQYRLQQPISLHFKDVPLRTAIQDLKVQSGVQVVADEQALDKAKINLDSPLSISVDDIDMKSALNLMLNKLQLTYIIENQVLMITTEEKTKGRLVRITYPIGDLVVVVPDNPLPKVFDIRDALERSMQPAGWYGNNYLTPPPYPYSPGMPVSSHSGGLGNTFAGAQPMHGQSSANMSISKERTKEQMAETLKDLIQDTVNKNSWEKMGGNGNIQYFPMGMALVITQLQEVQEEVQLLLATLRKLQDLQVSIELRAVLVSETFFERIGVDFDMNIRTPTSRREPDLLNGTFVTAPFDNRTADKLGGLISGLTPAGSLTPDLNVPVRSNSFNMTYPQFGGYVPDAGLSLGLAFLSDIQVFMFLEAVQGDRRAHIMQAPKLTAFNGQLATITGITSRPQLQSLTPLALPNGNFIMIPQFNQMPLGMTLVVQPVVSPDRRFIRLNITPIFTNGGVQDPAAPSQIIPIPLFGNPIFDSGQNQPPLANQPVLVNTIPQLQPTQLIIAQTTVNVPDGGTVLLGGFKFLAEERTEFGPPVLSKIPYLSRLFRNVGWSRDSSTLIYLVTARVIMVEEEERIFLGEIPPIPGR
jgi:type II secretory pathway component GspD/PulD (secretin)